MKKVRSGARAEQSGVAEVRVLLANALSLAVRMGGAPCSARVLFADDIRVTAHFCARERVAVDELLRRFL